MQPRLRDQSRYLALAGTRPLPLGRADLLYLWDDYRGEYLDFAALGNPVGHAHPLISQKIAEHFRYYGHTAPQGQHLLRWPVEYAKQLSDCYTGQDEKHRQVLFCEGEREAVRLAVEVATQTGVRARPVPPVVAVVGPRHDGLGQVWNYPWDYDPDEAVWDKLAAILINPVDESARVIGSEAARRWILAARERQVPVIYDESVTGFGRLGTMWGQERSGLTADLTVLGGPCGGGLPLGAVIGPSEYFTGLDAGDVSRQAGHPVSCCAGSTLLDVVGVGVLEYMEDTVPLLTRGLDELCAQFPDLLIGHHGEGLLRGLRFADPEAAERFGVDCRSHGLYVAPPVGDTVVLAPPLIISTNEMTRGVDLCAATLMVWEDQNRPV